MAALVGMMLGVDWVLGVIDRPMSTLKAAITNSKAVYGLIANTLHECVVGGKRKMVQSLEGEELEYDLLVLVPPHKGAQVLMDSGIAPEPGGWLPTDHKTLNVGGREHMWALGDATDLPLSKAGSTAHFEAPVIADPDPRPSP